jgi:hypothetical protein
MDESITKEQVAKTLKNLFDDEPFDPVILWNYRKAAAVLEYFSFNEIHPVEGGKNKDDALKSLYDVSFIVYDGNRQLQRSLKDDVRREALKRLYSENGTAGLQAALATNPNRPQTELQKLLEDYINGKFPHLKEQSRKQMLCTAKISNWLSGIIANVPEPSVVSQRIAVENLLAPFKFLLNISTENPGGTFFGRENEIKKLYDYAEVYKASSGAQAFVRQAREIFDIREKLPLMIHALGGTGKSTLLAKFIHDHARYEHPINNTSADKKDDRFPFVYLDFDNPSISPAEPITLLLEALGQLSIQYPEHSALLLEMRDEWVTLIRSGNSSRRESPQLMLDLQIENRAPFIESFAQVINNKINIKNAPLLFLLDTFEVPQNYSQAFVEGILKFLADLQNYIPRLRTIISGRTEVISNSYKIENYPLPPFDLLAAQKFLQKNGIEDLTIAEEIFLQVGGSPLNLRIAARVYKLEGINPNIFKDLKKKENFDSKLQEEMIRGVLYQRFLEHIKNESVKQLAHPGLVLRRITPELIYEVLAKPCEIDVPDLSVAEDLFEKLKKETDLVSSQDSTVVVQRPDVRGVMLKLLRADRPGKVNQIHENAIKYYEKFDDDTSRKEEIYHRLSLGLDRAKLDIRWRSNLRFWKDEIEELPPRSQGYLAARLPVEIEQSVWDAADFEDWERYAVRTARELIKADRPDEALKLIERRKDGRKSKEISTIKRESEIRQATLNDLQGQSFTRAHLTKMSNWYSPAALARTAKNIIIATFSRDNAAVGSISQSKSKFFDYSKELIRTIDDFKPLEEITTKEVWIDYVADIGDGWNSTYSVAYNLAKPQLEVAEQTLSRGEILIFGGDPVYPTASMEEYRDRLIIPYRMAFKAGGASSTTLTSDIVNLKKEPHLFALPGSGDWDNNLSAFRKIFCSYFYNNRNFADGWYTRQKQSYFALKLPHNWWLLGFDLHLGRDYDESQFQYFESVFENIKAGDKVILCVQEPYWTSAIKYQDLTDKFNLSEESLERIEDFLARRGININVYLSGGLHHYRRFENGEGVQRITAGGGGAFLHPTHDFDFGKLRQKSKKSKSYFLTKVYPEYEESRRLDWKLLYSFFAKNKTFGHIAGFAYMTIAWLISAQLPPELNWQEALIATIVNLIYDPLAALFLMLVLVACVFFTDSNSRMFKVVAGVTHGLTNLAAIFLTLWLSFFLSYQIIGWYVIVGDFTTANLIRFVCTMITAYLGGYLFATIIMSIYLFVSIHLFGRHYNEAFSALKIEDYKNFLRLHIDDKGKLTIYALKIEKVWRKWKPIFGYYEPVESNSNSEPKLIEPPIIIK